MIDKHQATPIQLICSINTKGEFTPIRFRFRELEGDMVTIDVKEILHYESNSLTVFICVSGLFYNQLHSFQLVMQKSTNQWKLTQIQ